MNVKELIENGKAILGIELGSTRIKAVLIEPSGGVIDTGVYEWENSLVDGIWTYSLDEAIKGMQNCYSCLRENILKTYGVSIKRLAAIGISAMMHGIIALDKDDELLTPFQTWRNTNTEQAADELTNLFQFNIPQRWTIAHIYQCILEKEEYCKQFAHVFTLAGYIHYCLTGEFVIGIDDASGMFPIDPATKDFNQKMLDQFDDLISKYGYTWRIRGILPKVLCAGDCAGKLTCKGAHLLDPSGELKSGIPLCPPEGDAGTGMVATNSVARRTGNVSAGTSIFAMVVLDKQLSKVYREIDLVTTPEGYPVAMSHANNGTSDLNAWIRLFAEFSELMGYHTDEKSLFGKLYENSLDGDPDCGGLLAYGYYSGENITKVNEGRLAFLRTPNANFNLKNFIRVHLYTSLGAVKVGMDILKKEGINIDKIQGHGGLFKTKGVGQKYLAAAVNAPVTVMDHANEGGAWGIALLAAYMVRQNRSFSLSQYLDEVIFSSLEGTTIIPEEKDVQGFERYEKRYIKGLSIEQEAIRSMNWE